MPELQIKNALNAIARANRERAEYLANEHNKQCWVDAADYYGIRLEEINYPLTQNNF